MTVHFYVHHFDLDHLNKLLKNPITDIEDPDYILEVYAQSRESLLQNIYILVGISYEDFMRIQEYLEFK